MKVVLQRVLQAQVRVEGKVAGQIDKGLLVYLSISKGDTQEHAKFIAGKLAGLRVFEDSNGKMNRSIVDIGGSMLLVSNFTLDGDCRKGRRPSFDGAAEPELAKKLYEKVCELVAEYGVKIEKGVFAAHMHVSSVNDGPVTFILET